MEPLSDDLERRARELMSGDEVGDHMRDEHELAETRYQIDRDEETEMESLREDLELLREDNPEAVALAMDSLEAWLLSPYTPRTWKWRIRKAIRDRLG